MSPPRLAAVATAVPPHRLGQGDVAARARRVFGARRVWAFERLAPAFGHAGIETRYGCAAPEWYEAEHDWPERNNLFLTAALDLIEAAAERALAKAGLGARDIDALVTVSTTGIATPALDARLMDRMPFRRDVLRLPVFGLGCAGGVLGLARAADLVRAMPGRRVLLLVVELCSLTFRIQDSSTANIIAAALFGDGAAAAVVDSAADGPALGAAGEHTWPDSLDVMGWRVEADGFGVLFSRDIPTLVRRDLRAAADVFLARNGLALGGIDGFACHPGGAKVMDALEDAFDLAPGALADARAVLRDYGNMSAPTVLFVLERMLAADPRRRLLLSALGPGFTAGFLLVDGRA